MIYQEKIFTKEECDKIIEIINITKKTDGKNKYDQTSDGYVSFDEYKIEDNENNNWFMDKIKLFIENTLNIKLIKLNKDAQILCYGINDGFAKHLDYNVQSSDPRIYTFGILLNNDFEGGEFVLYHNGIETQLKKDIGNCYIFDTKILHEVKKITNGKRYSLIIHIKNSEIKKALL
jgi:predicted 2-oxoglutarate/Fe(II)-dependent dioxygenase YbiX